MSDRVKFSVKPHTSGPDFHRSCLSAYFLYVSFIEYNAAIRTSITSAQITQAEDSEVDDAMVVLDEPSNAKNPLCLVLASGYHPLIHHEPQADCDWYM